MKIWKWLLSFFWKPKQLPKRDPNIWEDALDPPIGSDELPNPKLQAVDIATAFLSAVRDAEEKLMKQKQETIELEKKLRANNELMVKAMSVIGTQLISKENGNIYLFPSNLELKTGDWKIFIDIFKEFCSSNDISVKISSDAFVIDDKSLAAYRERCEKQTKIKKTITTSEYR